MVDMSWWISPSGDADIEKARGWQLEDLLRDMCERARGERGPIKDKFEHAIGFSELNAKKSENPLVENPVVTQIHTPRCFHVPRLPSSLVPCPSVQFSKKSDDGLILRAARRLFRQMGTLDGFCGGDGSSEG